MIYFNNDYAEGAHPRVMNSLFWTNLEQSEGYGEDDYCKKARELIRKECCTPNAGVEFLVGGTQVNLTVIDAVLHSYQGVLCAESGHINVHETGAIEACGHKVLALPAQNGKITSFQIEEYCLEHWKDEAHEHMVQPGMVYISYPTELGTLYSKKELEEISTICKKWKLLLFLDGARLGYGLMSPENDVTLADIANLTDVFYIGGTKVGALFGEAVVITSEKIAKDFRYIMKQKGGLLAKGRTLGVQFLELFKDGLYFELGKHAIEMAMLLKEGLINKKYQLFIDSPTNQQFVIMDEEKLKQIREKYQVTYFQKYNENSAVVRLCTNWATKRENIEKLLEEI